MSGPTSGKIFINDSELESIENKAYYSLIGYVPQESIFYDLSVAENIKFFREDITNEKILEVCELLKMDFISKLNPIDLCDSLILLHSSTE